MYERMLNKESKPSTQDVMDYIGIESKHLLEQFEKRLSEQYDLKKELCFPFGNNYGWGYKYSHKSLHLCHAFFEKDAFTVTIQVGDRQVPILESVMYRLSEQGKGLWNNRYPCGDNGGWVHYRVFSEEDLNDILIFINAKKKPILIKKESE